MQLSPAQQQRLLLAVSLIAMFLCGMAAMQLLQSWRLGAVQGFVLEQDTRPKVCTVTVDGILDGNVTGTLTGSGRVFIGDTQALPTTDGSFAVPAGSFLTRRISITIPAGAQFVASKKGSKAYPLRSSQAQKIAPQNRVYFPSREQAEAAGYHL